MSEDVFVARRDGGIGKDRAMLKRWITVCRDARTSRRVRSRGRASGSCIDGSGGKEGLREVLGDPGSVPGLVVRAAGDEGPFSVGEDAASKPFGTNARIASSRPPRDESESASESASPRSNSTS